MSTVTTLVLLHGWGAHGGVWTDVSARLGDRIAVQAPDIDGNGSLEDAVDRLAARAPTRCVVAGWSLGGQLALSWAHRHAAQVQGLILLATTPRFVAAPDWRHGMAAETFGEFAAMVDADAEAALRRFRLLETRGDFRARAVIRQLDRLLAARKTADAAVLARMLGWLRDTDLRVMLPAISQPAMVIHGDHDSVVTPPAADFLSARLPRAHVEHIGGAAHVPFVSAVERVCALMCRFCNDS
ncbi:MAG: alpha/beta fold hydrolase [Burkholderiales bacterium]|nr:alpha/beta fold hydrolase [Burkholderiales bacterium]